MVLLNSMTLERTRLGAYSVTAALAVQMSHLVALLPRIHQEYIKTLVATTRTHLECSPGLIVLESVYNSCNITVKDLMTPEGNLNAPAC